MYVCSEQQEDRRQKTDKNGCTSLPSFPAFAVHSEPTTIATRWEKYLKHIENMFVAFAVTDAARKKALLLHYAGADVMDIHDTLPEPDETDVDPDQKMDEYQKVATQLTTYFLPKRNIEYERFMFR